MTKRLCPICNTEVLLVTHLMSEEFVFACTICGVDGNNKSSELHAWKSFLGKCRHHKPAATQPEPWPPEQWDMDRLYVTRDSRKARIVCTDRVNPKRYPLLALVADADGNEWTQPYTNRGTCDSTHLNLVGYWAERPEVDWSVISPWFNWMAMDDSGKWHAFDNVPQLNELDGYWGFGQNALLIPADYAPKFEGDWKDSLIERPKGDTP